MLGALQPKSKFSLLLSQGHMTLTERIIQYRPRLRITPAEFGVATSEVDGVLGFPVINASPD